MTRVTLLCVMTLASVASSFPTGPIGHHKQPDGFFTYVNVPGPKEYEAGWKRGNDKHHISRFEQVKDHTFRTRVKWSDAHDGHGEHYWEYNHAPKHKDHYHPHKDHYHHPEPHKDPYHSHSDPHKDVFKHEPIKHKDPYSPHQEIFHHEPIKHKELFHHEPLHAGGYASEHHQAVHEFSGPEVVVSETVETHH